MTKAEVLEFLSKKQWGPSDQQQLVKVWNELKGDTMGPIGINAVRSPCRLKQVRTSLLQFANAEMV